MNISTKLILRRTLVIGAFLISTNFLHAAIIYVDPSAVGTNNGTSWANAYTSLNSALSSANNGDEVWVKQGVYKPVTAIDFNSSGGVDAREVTFQIPNGVALYGGFTGTELSRNERNWILNPTILSGDIDNNDINIDGNSIAETTADIAGNNAYHIIYTLNVNASTRVDGFIITAGYANNGVAFDANQDGGAWYNKLDGAVNASSPAIVNNIFRGNYAASEGGAIFCFNGSAGAAVLSLIQNCKFLNNKSNNAGGAVNIGSFSPGNYQPHFIKCEFSNNEAYRRGGGIYFVGDHAILDSCTFQNNIVTAISPDGSTLPGSGGGVVMTNSNAHFNNCTFTGNSATGNPTGAFEGGGGGAVYMSSNEPQATTLGVSEPVFVSCGFYSNTVSGNTAAWGGAAVHLSDAGKLRPKYVNCVFEGNEAQNDGGAIANFTRVLGVAAGYVPELKPNYTNCTFADNSSNRGGAIFNDGFLFMGTTEVLQSRIENCILWDDAATTSGPEVFNTGGNIVVAYSLIEGSGGSGGGWNASIGTDGGNNIAANPGFINAADPDGADNIPGTNDDGLRVGTTSPAVDAGNNAAAGIVGITADYTGANRILGGEVDMGAYERAGIIIPNLDIYWLDEWRPYNPPCLSCPWAVLLTDRVFPQYVWDGPAQLIDDGKTAVVTGKIINTRDRQSGFKVYIKLINKQDWKSWSSKGRTYTAITPEAIIVAFLTHKNWTFWELSNESYLEGTGDISGKLALSKYPTNNKTGFQLGTGANEWDKDLGLGGSFAYKGTLKHKGKEIKVSGTGSVNVDADKCKRSCVPLVEPSRPVLQRTITGNNEIQTDETKEGFTIFPVPAHNRLTIIPNNLTDGKYALKLYSSAGQLKKQESVYVNKANIIILIEGLQPGIYILQLVSSSGEMFSKKLVVE